MLVLSRKVGEAIQIDGPARVVLVRVAGGAVRLGIESPQGVKILREELLSRDRDPAVA